MVDPTTKKRGADPAVPEKPRSEKPHVSDDKKLEQGLEESMADSDPVAITQLASGPVPGSFSPDRF